MPEITTLGAPIKATYSPEPKAFTDPLYDKLVALQSVQLQSNQLLSGSATWVSGLTFNVSICVFVVNGVIYTSAAGQVTLAAADATNPRIDVIAVNTSLVPVVVAGTAAADPAKPEVDPNTQVEVTFALVAALATTPTGVANTNAYLENTEWTSGVSGGTVNAADTSDPYAGTKDIKFTAAANGAFVTLTSATSYSPAAFTALGFFIKCIAYGVSAQVRARIALYNTATRVSNWIDLRNGDYGFVATNLASYQFIQIPILDFAMTGSSFNRIRVEVAANGANTMTFLLDNIFFQAGVPSTQTEDFARLSLFNVFTKAQGMPLQILTDGTTIAWDMSATNMFQVTLAGNRTMAAPTNIRPGYKYNLIVIQDGTGNRTITWNAVFKWRNDIAPILSQAAAAFDVFEFVADASGNLHGSIKDTAYNTQYIGQNLQTGTSYTLLETDKGKCVSMSNGSANTLTIPANSSVPFPINTRIDVFQRGAGQTTVAITTDTLRGDPKIPSQYKMVSLWKIAATEWVIAGGTT